MGLAYFEVYAALCGLPGTGSRRSHLGAQQHGDKGASLQGRRHWMASSHANGAQKREENCFQVEQNGVCFMDGLQSCSQCVDRMSSKEVVHCNLSVL
eukprot:scaffold69798_cov20-Tisochrysis_lutea.AAC.2